MGALEDDLGYAAHLKNIGVALERATPEIVRNACQGKQLVVPKIGIGDVNSDAKGSGARFNAGKPDLSLIPLAMIAENYSTFAGRPNHNPAVNALGKLGDFQRTHETRHLFAAISLLGTESWKDCARVFEYGKKKYAAWNWAKGMPWSVALACGARHLIAILDGEETDPESGLPHRGHVVCNIVMLLQYTKTYQEGNDLPPVGVL